MKKRNIKTKKKKPPLKTVLSAWCSKKGQQISIPAKEALVRKAKSRGQQIPIRTMMRNKMNFLSLVSTRRLLLRRVSRNRVLRVRCQVLRPKLMKVREVVMKGKRCVFNLFVLVFCSWKNYFQNFSCLNNTKKQFQNIATRTGTRGKFWKHFRSLRSGARRSCWGSTHRNTTTRRARGFWKYLWIFWCGGVVRSNLKFVSKFWIQNCFLRN